jgi:uncharacterized protein YjbI with pentapeptide repeats
MSESDKRMADPQHVDVLKKGASFAREWVAKHNCLLDLYRANLEGIDVSGVDLSFGIFSFANMRKSNLHGAEAFQARFIGTDLSGAMLTESKIYCTQFVSANLSEVDFSKAEAYGTIFISADLSGTKFINADLSQANFTRAILDNADLGKAELYGAIFSGSSLKKTDFKEAILSHTIFAACDLNNCLGLEKVRHEGPSEIGLETLILTFRNAGNCFTPQMEVFLTNAGVPKQVIDNMPKIFASIRFYSCFIAYGEPNKAFAERIKKDLVARGLSCWVYSLDYTPGERTWPEIIQKRREADRMIVLCSAASLLRDGVLKEIEEQIDEDPEKILPVSLDNIWKEPAFAVKRGSRDMKQFLLDHNYADFSDEAKYNQALCRLLSGLKKKS